MRTTTFTLIGAAIATGLLAGCTAPAPEEASKFPLSGLQEYETPDEIASDLNEGGFNCERFERQSGSMNAASSGHCWRADDAGEEKEIILMIFNTDKNQQDQADLYRSIGPTFGLDDWPYGFVEGGNWMVNCETPSTCSAVSAILGGRKDTQPLL